MLANATRGGAEAWDVTNETGCERCTLLLRARDVNAAELDATRAQVMAGIGIGVQLMVLLFFNSS